ncbi:MAG: hypothetical protein ACLUOI_12850 [Eisenbergiella sp.]
MKRKANGQRPGFWPCSCHWPPFICPSVRSSSGTESPLPLPQIKVEETEHGTILIDAKQHLSEAYPGEEILRPPSRKKGINWRP